MCLCSDYRIDVLTEWKDRDQFRATEVKWAREESGNKTGGDCIGGWTWTLQWRSQKAANLAFVLEAELGLQFKTDASLDI